MQLETIFPDKLTLITKTNGFKNLLSITTIVIAEIVYSFGE